VATCRVEERLWASMGPLAGAPLRFEAAVDVSGGGVLCAVPVLLGMGLVRHSRTYSRLPPGYYPLESVFLAVAFLALARVPSMGALRYEPPGEWGRFLELDQMPGVRTLREKLGWCAGRGSGCGSGVAAWRRTGWKRRLDQAVRRTQAELVRLQAQFGAMSLPAQSDSDQAAEYEQGKGRLLEHIHHKQ